MAQTEDFKKRNVKLQRQAKQKAIWLNGKQPQGQFVEMTFRHWFRKKIINSRMNYLCSKCRR